MLFAGDVVPIVGGLLTLPASSFHSLPSTYEQQVLLLDVDSVSSLLTKPFVAQHTHSQTHASVFFLLAAVYCFVFVYVFS